MEKVVQPKGPETVIRRGARQTSFFLAFVEGIMPCCFFTSTLRRRRLRPQFFCACSGFERRRLEKRAELVLDKPSQLKSRRRVLKIQSKGPEGSWGASRG